MNDERVMTLRSKDGTVIDVGDLIEVEAPMEPPWRAKVERTDPERGLRVYPVGHPGHLKWIAPADVPRAVTYIDSPDE